MSVGSSQVIALSIVPAILAITVHEVMHGYIARHFGDDTAERMGRLTLNPIKHVDIVGTIIVPAILILSQSGFLFGWAKPVPVNFFRLRNPRRDMVYVAAAGPAANFAMMFGWGIALRIMLLFSPWHSPIGGGAGFVIEPLKLMCILGIMYNVVLGVFNLIPIPPLDGGRILVGLLPPDMARQVAGLERYGMFIIIAMLMLLPGFIGTLIFPILRVVSVIFGIPPTMF